MRRGRRARVRAHAVQHAASRPGQRRGPPGARARGRTTRRSGRSSCRARPVSTGSSPLMPVLADYYDDSISEYEFDPERRTRAHGGGGLHRGRDGMFPVSFRLIYAAGRRHRQWAQLVKDTAAEAGITIELQGTGAQHLPGQDATRRLRHLRRQLRRSWTTRPTNFAAVVPARRAHQLHPRRRPRAQRADRQGQRRHDRRGREDRDHAGGREARPRQGVRQRHVHAEPLRRPQREVGRLHVEAERAAVDRQPDVRWPAPARPPAERGGPPACPSLCSSCAASAEGCSRSGSPSP